MSMKCFKILKTLLSIFTRLNLHQFVLLLEFRGPNYLIAANIVLSYFKSCKFVSYIKFILETDKATSAITKS